MHRDSGSDVLGSGGRWGLRERVFDRYVPVYSGPRYSGISYRFPFFPSFACLKTGVFHPPPFAGKRAMASEPIRSMTDAARFGQITTRFPFSVGPIPLSTEYSPAKLHAECRNARFDRVMWKNKRTRTFLLLLFTNEPKRQQADATNKVDEPLGSLLQSGTASMNDEGGSSAMGLAHWVWLPSKAPQMCHVFEGRSSSHPSSSGITRPCAVCICTFLL